MPSVGRERDVNTMLGQFILAGMMGTIGRRANVLNLHAHITTTDHPIYLVEC
jgi:hypothetical protein